MSEFTEIKCPQCGQKLRIPRNIGGMLMACPSCGKKFHTDFKFTAGAPKQAEPRGMVISIFELPNRIITRIWRLITLKQN
jgi:DNA-directed RNA polymerase subunit RPC12/RpoP